MAFFSGLQRGFGRAIDPRQIAMARALAEAQDAFERPQDHEIARQRARETGRDYLGGLLRARAAVPPAGCGSPIPASPATGKRAD